MPIDRDRQVNASTILSKESYQRLKEISRKNKRSVSSQIAWIVEYYIDKLEVSEDGTDAAYTFSGAQAAPTEKPKRREPKLLLPGISEAEG